MMILTPEPMKIPVSGCFRCIARFVQSGWH